MKKRKILAVVWFLCIPLMFAGWFAAFHFFGGYVFGNGGTFGRMVVGILCVIVPYMVADYVYIRTELWVKQ